MTEGCINTALFLLSLYHCQAFIDKILTLEEYPNYSNFVTFKAIASKLPHLGIKKD
jgi:hypothetical protein